MKIMFLNGGLANQMFQYIFYRYGQITNPAEDWYLDDSFFYVNHVHNGYELERVFSLRPNLLSEYFDADVWDYMIEQKRQGISIPQQLLDNGIDIKMISEYGNWRQWNPFTGEVKQLNGHFEDRMLKIKDNIYFNGYALKDHFFRGIENMIRSEFVFPEIDDEGNLKYLKEIKNTNSCAVHVRRGDYVTLGYTGEDDVFNRIYNDMISRMLKNVPDITVFLFSDDLNYCEAHFEEMGLDRPKEVIFIRGNSGEKAFRDMQLMAECTHMIAANSSFPYMAFLLNRDPGIILNIRN